MTAIIDNTGWYVSFFCGVIVGIAIGIMIGVGMRDGVAHEDDPPGCMPSEVWINTVTGQTRCMP